MDAVSLDGSRSAMSPKTLARLAALFFLVTMVLGIVAQLGLEARLVMPRDAAATAANLRAQPDALRLAFSIFLVEMLSQITMIGLFYTLLRPAGRLAARIALLYGLAGVTIKTMSRLLFIAPLSIVGGAAYLAVFEPAQLESLALLSFKLNDVGAAIALAFFGVETMLQGYLVLRSTFLPRFLGAIQLVAGLGWMTFVSPTLGIRLFPIVAGVGLLGALLNIGWLLVKGVDAERWRAMDAAASPG
jgi:hypothetical protein